MDVSQSNSACSTGSCVAFEDLEEYTHFVLPDPRYRIRLVELLPGDFSDDVRVQIYHSVLVPPDSEDDGRLSLSELQKTMPENWQVYQVLMGGFFSATWKRLDGSILGITLMRISIALGTSYQRSVRMGSRNMKHSRMLGSTGRPPLHSGR